MNKLPNAIDKVTTQVWLTKSYIQNIFDKFNLPWSLTHFTDSKRTLVACADLTGTTSRKVKQFDQSRDHFILLLCMPKTSITAKAPAEHTLLRVKHQLHTHQNTVFNVLLKDEWLNKLRIIISCKKKIKLCVENTEKAPIRCDACQKYRHWVLCVAKHKPALWRQIYYNNCLRFVTHRTGFTHH